MPTNVNVKLIKKEQLKPDILKFTCESKKYLIVQSQVNL